MFREKVLIFFINRIYLCVEVTNSFKQPRHTEPSVLKSLNTQSLPLSFAYHSMHICREYEYDIEKCVHYASLPLGLALQSSLPCLTIPSCVYGRIVV